mmetsp:Transcript_8132/g.18102  ORF Transcript_8132/g.18102 Transcript_8132/m.18102 type:complete len:234 (+) Transcript_8132:209-910(+)
MQEVALQRYCMVPFTTSHCQDLHVSVHAPCVVACPWVSSHLQVAARSNATKCEHKCLARAIELPTGLPSIWCEASKDVVFIITKKKDCPLEARQVAVEGCHRYAVGLRCVAQRPLWTGTCAYGQSESKRQVLHEAPRQGWVKHQVPFCKRSVQLNIGGKNLMLFAEHRMRLLSLRLHNLGLKPRSCARSHEAVPDPGQVLLRTAHNCIDRFQCTWCGINISLLHGSHSLRHAR